jgi:glycosyltransferase involved in cell wall biosynthesis
MFSISVVITCYREGELILDAVNSVLAQSLLPLEIIIINDASSDRTAEEVAKNYPKVIVLQGDGNLWWTGAIFHSDQIRLKSR